MAIQKQSDYVKYMSIDNINNPKALITAEGEKLTGGKWIALEKVHGANFCFLAFGGNDPEKSVRYASRNWLLNKKQPQEKIDPEDFMGCGYVLKTYNVKVMNMFNDVKEKMPSLSKLQIFGEIYGGFYSKEAMCKAKKKNMNPIQECVYYNPNHDFYAFDIYYELKDGRSAWMKYDNAMSLFEKHGFFYAKPLVLDKETGRTEGTFAEVMAYNEVFTTTIPDQIPELKDIPRIERNIAEGIVIKPVVPMFDSQGNRVIFKKKNELEYPEVTPPRPIPLDSDFSKEVHTITEHLIARATEHRLDSVISKEGEINWKTKKDFEEDCLKDYFKEDPAREEQFSTLTFLEQGFVKRKLGVLTANIINQKKEALKKAKEERERLLESMEML